MLATRHYLELIADLPFVDNEKGISSTSLTNNIFSFRKEVLKMDIECVD